MKADAIILSVETATLRGSVSISKGNSILGQLAGEAQVSHSNTLLADINRILTQTGLQLDQADVFAVATGPGSFTGLRIGIATVKALSATLGRPCAGIPTLEAIAHAAGASTRSVALMPAGRGEVFAQMFSVSLEGTVTALDSPSHITPDSMIDKYGDLEGICWCGDGALIYRERIEERARQRGFGVSDGQIGKKHPSSWRFAQPEPYLASHIGALALAKVATAQLETPGTLAAVYVRPSDAELKAK
ncbi:MAG TPA: tRNA (adenosine(37)-N6)-threonylcarbamoyltransferase complex dimerization subunit type 1 TsaB [Pyrinomonadaceae bacterium]|nr:tRNA (adenosine(37)-N6)-threonylcarbamoyltransferase complex dimerization subunit type 1 TsaB [Pyrinomonadaceae bacterium]